MVIQEMLHMVFQFPQDSLRVQLHIHSLHTLRGSYRHRERHKLIFHRRIKRSNTETLAHRTFYLNWSSWSHLIFWSFRSGRSRIYIDPSTTESVILLAHFKGQPRSLIESPSTIRGILIHRFFIFAKYVVKPAAKKPSPVLRKTVYCWMKVNTEQEPVSLWNQKSWLYSITLDNTKQSIFLIIIVIRSATIRPKKLSPQ